MTLARLSCGLAVVVTALFSCSTSKTDAACPFPATSCEDGCMAIDAWQLDPARGCRFRVILGCMGPGEQTTDNACFRNVEDGRIVTGSGSAIGSRPGWRRCELDESDPIARADFCGDAGAGAGAH